VTDPAPEILRGVGVSPGIALGRALVLEGPPSPVERVALEPAACDAEVARLEDAVRVAARQLRRLRARVRQEAGAACARVFQAQILILKDPALRQETIGLIRAQNVSAEWAVQAVLGRYARVFDDLRDDDLHDRGSDIEDVEERLVTILTGRRRRHDLEGMADDVIVVSRSLSPSDAAGLGQARVVGLAIDGGGPTSHTAIVAGALGIPAVVGLRRASALVRSGDALVVDGASGLVQVRPGPDAIATWKRRIADRARAATVAPAPNPGATTTIDGLPICLMANIKVPEEIDLARRLGAEGIGLYRSEFLYLSSAPGLPGEERQVEVYGDLAERSRPHEVVIRTLDLGGEEYAARVLGQREANPVLGLRGIRLGLRRPGLLRTQLRAILRAGVRGKVRVLLPMVSSIEEVDQARTLIDEARRELRIEGHPCLEEVHLGVMIEVPAAALVARRLAERADFFAIGTNDLIQYTLAIDRGNEGVAYLYHPLHPAILDLLRRVIDAAEARGRRLSVCGEMAADPINAVVLVGMGVTELSMSPAAVPLVRRVVTSVTAREARAIADEALTLSTTEEIAARVRSRVLAALPAALVSALEEPVA
jgi:phosphotransferase system enzyme I (PtsI)